MNNIAKIWNGLCNKHSNGALDWESNDAISFSICVSRHFRSVDGTKRGVYLILKNKDELIYIGKAGTLRQDGTYSQQDLSGRLRAPRESNQTANTWFGGLSKTHGRLHIKYLILPDSKPPASVEAQLLTEYFNKCKQLPLVNKSF